MSRIARFFYNTFKGIYDILASYLLVVVLYLTVVSLLLYGFFVLVAQGFGYDEVDHMWRAFSRSLGTRQIWVRLVVYGGLQAGIFWLLRGGLRWASTHMERVADGLQRLYIWTTKRNTRASKIAGATFSIMITLVLIPFVIQPTLVPMKFNQRTMIQRTANLLDGQATMGFADSVVGFYRKLYAEPDAQHGLSPKQLDRAFKHLKDEKGTGPLFPPKANGKQPMMDRWDPLIMQASAGDPKQFAFIKAFMWVESGGRQFAVSHTGCSGLMQFCAGTARRQPFRKVFGTGQVYKCGCNGPCQIQRKVQRDMEQGDKSVIKKLSKSGAFPCEVTDARFNAQKAILAGGLYVQNLRKSFQSNIYLMYIGYNSGPAVAKRVYNALGQRGDITLKEIEVELAKALKHWYGDKADARARSLVRTHLPKIKKAYDRYYQAGQKKKPEAVAMK